MTGRWRALALLAVARTMMGLQFQSIPALTPQLVERGMSYAEVGTLAGLYLLPGVAIALAGGWLGQRFGERRVMLFGLTLMATGGLVLAVSDDAALWSAARIIAGSGAILMNVAATKMTADWFADGAMAVGMGVLVSSWPLGMALAMVLLPGLAADGSVLGALLTPPLVTLAVFVLVALAYRDPPGMTPTTASGTSARLSRAELANSFLAGSVWALFNISFIVLMTFGAGAVAANGRSETDALAMVSLLGWLIIPTVAAGGLITARIGRPDATIVGCCAASAGLILMVPYVDQSLVLLAALATLGLVFGPPAAAIMTLPAQATRPEVRSAGMGIYFATFYAGMGVGPAIAGALRDATGSAAAPLWFAAASLLGACAALAMFRVALRSSVASATA